MTTWRVPRESTEWVGPIVVTVVDNGTGEPVADPVQFAVLNNLFRPQESDWADPYLDPDDTGALGVFLEPVTSYTHLGIWARVAGNPEIPVLDPNSVGKIIRT